MKLPTIPPGLAGSIVKYRPLSKPISLQDLEDSARSQTWKKSDIWKAHVNVKVERRLTVTFTRDLSNIVSI